MQNERGSVSSKATQKWWNRDTPEAGGVGLWDGWMDKLAMMDGEGVDQDP